MPFISSKLFQVSTFSRFEVVAISASGRGISKFERRKNKGTFDAKRRASPLPKKTRKIVSKLG